MGKKGNWFAALKKALSSDSKDKRDQKTPKSKRKWFGKHKSSEHISFLYDSSTVAVVSPAPPTSPVEDVNLTEAENDQSKHAYTVALATAVAAEAAVAAAQAAAEVVCLTATTRYPGKSKEEIAAIKIQTAFRGCLARRALRALRGLVRLKCLLQGQSVKQQANTTLRCMQTLARVQSQIRARRLRMSEENQALQRQLEKKQEKEHEKFKAFQMAEEWNDSTQSKEQIEAKLQNKQEATMRRERALAYAFSHQQFWKNSSNSKFANQTFMDPNNPHWGWSWLERWMAARPWESRAIDNNDLGSVKSAASRVTSISEISRSYSHCDLNRNNKALPIPHKSTRPPSRQSPSTPSKAPATSSVTRKIKPPSPKGSQWGGDDDSRSIFSSHSEHHRRHSIAWSSLRDNESLAISPSVPSYMLSTKSAKARSGLPSPLGSNLTSEKGSFGSAKKRLSFPSTPADSGTRRHSGPPSVEISSIKGMEVPVEEKVSNGGSR